MASKMHNSTEQLPYALRQDLRLIHEAWYVLGGGVETIACLSMVLLCVSRLCSRKSEDTADGGSDGEPDDS